MAYFNPSDLVQGQAKFDQRVLDGGEWRMPDSVALQVANMSAITNPSLNSLKYAQDTTENAYFPIRQAAIGTSAIAHDHTGASPDSLGESPSYSIYAEPFSITKKQAEGNVFSWSEMYASGLRNAVYNLIGRLDAAFVAALVAAKTGYGAAGGNGEFDTSLDAYKNPAGEELYFIQNMRQFMNINDYRGQLIGLMDDRLATKMQRAKAQGAGNSTNTAFQFDGMNLFATSRTILGSTYNGSGLFFESGMAGLIFWLPKANRKPLDPKQAFSSMGDYGMFTIPSLPGIQFGIHAYGTRSDGHSIGGDYQDETYQFEVSAHMAYLDAPISTFRDAADTSPIYAGVQLT